MGHRADPHRLQLSLPANASALIRARRAVEHVDALNGFPEAQFALRVLVSELFANGVKYGGDDGQITLELEVRDDCVHVEVGDRGDGFAPTDVSMANVEATSGRGLALLDSLADRWGVTRTADHRVWFELELH